jgi:hypothetical protein
MKSNQALARESKAMFDALPQTTQRRLRGPLRTEAKKHTKDYVIKHAVTTRAVKSHYSGKLVAYSYDPPRVYFDADPDEPKEDHCWCGVGYSLRGKRKFVCANTEAEAWRLLAAECFTKSWMYNLPSYRRIIRAASVVEKKVGRR